MYCEKCGRKCPKRSVFCPHCGFRMKKQPKKKRTGGCLIAFFSILIFLAVILIVILYFFPKLLSSAEPGSVSNSSIMEVDIPDEFYVTPPDAESYYENNATVQDIFEAGDSEDALTEAEVYELLTGRGFGENEITSTYTMEGEFYDAAEISESSDEKHPVYETYYFSASGDIWIVSVINNTIVATPVSYNLQSDLGVQVLIAESDTITSYDSTTNQFFETTPNENVLLVVTVDSIDAGTLDGLTVEEIDRHVK